MKISPIAASGIPTNQPATLDTGRSAGADRVARAKAVLSGQDPGTVTSDPQVARAESSMRRIKMRTQVSPDRDVTQNLSSNTASDTTASVTSNDISDPIEPQESSEATKPLSPQFAALAKQKRELQLKERELLAKEQALATQSTDTKSFDEYRARLKANALSVLKEEGVTYDQLTEQILAEGNDNGPQFTRLEAEIKALKEGLENQNKTQTDRESQAEKQVLSQMRREADQLIAQGEDFEMVREAGYAPKAIELIHKTWKQTGEVLDVTEALNLIENELLEESLKFARIKKVQSRLAPTPPTAQQGAQKTMRTLTNRDGVSASLTPRERAIAAFQGRLK